MTNEEAIMRIEALYALSSENSLKNIGEALHMAVAALRNQSISINWKMWDLCGNCKPSCANCISGDEYEDDCPIECQCCVNHNNYRPKDKYCSSCGRPLSLEAQAELEKRIRKMK